MIRVCVAGVTGWTGRAVADAVAASDDLELVAGVSRSDSGSFSSVAEALEAVGTDVLVDYTHASVVKQNVVAAIERGVAVVVGSSGFDDQRYATFSPQLDKPEYPAAVMRCPAFEPPGPVWVIVSVSS